MSKPKKRKAGRTKDLGCAFCQRPGLRSAEHVWPRWMHPYAGTAGQVRYENARGLARVSDSVYRERLAPNPPKQGSVLTIRTREVCAHCNNGWMSDLEEQAKPIFKTLWQANGSGLAVALSPDDCATLATWAIKTSWTRELSVSRHTATTQQMRLHLAEHRMPPQRAQVWLGRLRDSRELLLPRAVFSLAHQDAAFGKGERKRAVLTLIGIAGVALLVYTVDGDGVPTPDRDQAKWSRIWPLDDGATYPPQQAMDAWEARFAASWHSSGVRPVPNSTFEGAVS